MLGKGTRRAMASSWRSVQGVEVDFRGRLAGLIAIHCPSKRHRYALERSVAMGRRVLTAGGHHWSCHLESEALACASAAACEPLSDNAAAGPAAYCIGSTGCGSFT